MRIVYQLLFNINTMLYFLIKIEFNLQTKIAEIIQ